MRKLYFVCLAVMGLLSAATTASAQKTSGLYGVSAISVSPDGTYTATSEDGYAYVYLPDQDTCAYFGSETETYYVSNACNNYTMVGAYKDQAALITLTGVGEITPIVNILPAPAGYQTTDTEARGASLDLSLVAGYVSLSNGGDVMRAPVYWQADADGDYTAAILPYPTTDFSGRYPQAIDALDVTPDGSAICGRFIDWTGFYTVPIVWRKGQSGNWEYQLLGESIVFKGGEVHLECPDSNNSPQAPDPRDYMSVAEYEKFQLDSVLYLNNVLPSAPVLANYITDPDQIAAYNQAVAVYNAAATYYNQLLSQYFADLKAAITGVAFESQSIFMASNGKYVVTTGYTAHSNSNQPASYTYAFPLDTTQAVIRDTASVDYSAVVVDCDVEGNIYFISEASTYDTRCTYIIKPNEDKAVSLIDFLKELTAEKPYGEIDFTKFFTFATGFYDENGNVYYEDRTYTGNAHRVAGNPDRFYGTVYDLAVGGWLTYCIDLTPTSSISSVKDADVLAICRGNESIDIEGGVQSVEMVDAAGHVVYAAGAVSSIPVAGLQQGLYIVRMKSADGQMLTKKIML